MATAEENRKFTHDLLPSYPLDTAIDWISINLLPEEVFSIQALDYWAKANGYIQKE
ncbi:MAG TPA: hypothetical protein VLE21_05180 [Candidatus Nitrosocosmicus sp.]|nr:hypothetical protein [Candidatus Nitrosocosmicus sp.]